MEKMISVEIPEEIEEEVNAKGGFAHIQKLIPDDDIQKLSEIIKTLADEKRLTILYALSHQRMCVCMLAALTECSYSKCSYHIAKLKDIGLIQAAHCGNYLVYSLTSYGKRILKHLERIKEVKK